MLSGLPLNQSPPVIDSPWWRSLSLAERQTLEQADTGVRTDPDVLIIGGGIIGLATAYYLSLRKLSVVVLEAGSLGGQATGGNFGGVWPNDLGPSLPESFQALAFESRDLWGQLSLQPGFSFDWRVNGFINLNPARLVPSARDYADRALEQGYMARAVGHEQIASLEPALSDQFGTGVLHASEAHLHPLKACVGFVTASRRAGVRCLTQTAVDGLTLAGERVTAVHTDGATFTPQRIVFAAGWQLDWLAPHREALGLGSLPLRPVSGQILATDPVPPLLRHSVAGEFLVLQLKTGEILTGGNQVEGVADRVDDALADRMQTAARRLVPGLQDVPFTQRWVACRSATPDGLPVIDRSPKCDNLFVAAGHFRTGLLLAPATGKHLADWIATDTHPLPLAPFSARRFA